MTKMNSDDRSTRIISERGSSITVGLMIRIVAFVATAGFMWTDLIRRIDRVDLTLKQALRDQWSCAQDKVFMLEYTQRNGLKMTPHDKNDAMPPQE